MKKLMPLVLSVLLFATCKPTAPPANPEVEYGKELGESGEDVRKKPRNIILMIGDGMGLTQISAGLYSNGNQLELERFKWVGLHKSYSDDNLVTDSASGATAFSAGTKTYNGAIGVNPDTIPVPTILEKANEEKMATGLVATSTIVHATPASFIAHVPSRVQYERIAEAFVTTKIDLFIGGGKKYFDRRKKDERVLSSELKAKGFIVSDFIQDDDLAQIELDASQPFAYFTADADPLPVAQGRNYLVAASELACNFLDKRAGNKGFFLMIEGSQIDWGGHANNSDYIITEMIDFDRAIGKVLDFAEKDGETLVIVTADHETGGYAINPGSTRDSIIAGFTSTYHTAALIPVFAYGPGAQKFAGIYENTAIYDKMMALLFP